MISAVAITLLMVVGAFLLGVGVIIFMDFHEETKWRAECKRNHAIAQSAITAERLKQFSPWLAAAKENADV